MKLVRPGILLLLLLLSLRPASPQSSASFHSLTQGMRSGKLPPPQHLKDYVLDGRLSLSLRDAIVLALENNSGIQIDKVQIDDQKFAVLGAYAAFDPLLQSAWNLSRYSYPGYTQLQGVGQSSAATLNSLTQAGQVSYTQTFETGTNVLGTISSSRNSTNSSFYYFNPYYDSIFTIQITQPLLRGAGRFANVAPILVARRGLLQSQSTFRAEVSDLILQVIQQYWATVQARGGLQVSQKSLDLAEASYERDQRALQLGALPPLDIYRSQSEVAARRVQVIQAQYALAQAEEALRYITGADQDAQIHAFPLVLTENPEPGGEAEKEADADTLLQQALSQRPELQAGAAALDADRASIRLAHNQLLPNLTVSGFYQSNGLGGNEYNLYTGQLISTGGFNSSFNQLFGFGYPGYGGTVTLQLPFKNHAAEATLGTAMVTQRHDLYTLRQAREVITQQVNDAVHQLQQAKLALDAAKTSFALAQKSLTADQRKYELGAETNFFVLDSQARLAQTELVLLQTQVSYQIARATLSHATGDTLEPYHVQIRDLAR